jgi:hypothetical protein
MYELSLERKYEIEQSIDNILGPHVNDLSGFSLESVRGELDLWKIGRSKGAYPGSLAVVFEVMDDYVIVFEEDTKVTTKLVGHELAHIVLHQLPTKNWSRYKRWENSLFRMFEQKRTGEIYDTLQEHTEADYFSDYWNDRLAGVDWLKDTIIENLDEL